ncbi:MAG: hypothetical protein EOL88_02315 [Bacteroidia bacterium]|nr:hypothetical protein [Bacteroidia bacterium]
MLNKNQIENLIRHWQGKNQVDEAIKYQDRIDFHCKPYLSKNKFLRECYYYYDFKANLVEKILPNDKVETFLSLISPPLKTINFTDDIFNEIGRVLESANYSRQVRLPDNELNIFNRYLINNGIDDYWRKKVIRKLRNNINSIVICDKPQDGGDPYYYFIDLANLLYLSWDNNNRINSIIFLGVLDDEIQTINAYDADSYNVYEYKDNKIGRQIITSSHTLGYCPAECFWDVYISEENKYMRESPIAKDLSNLDWLLFFQTAKKYSDTYAPFPIIITYEQDEDDFNEQEISERVQVGKKGRLAGGAHIEIPLAEEGIDMMRNPMVIKSIPVENMEFIVDEIDRLEDEIRKNVIGTKGDIRNDAAKNEDQIEDASESQKKKLLKYKDSLNNICSWLYSTLASLMFNKPVRVVVDYGNDFYLKPIETMYSNLEMAKKQGSNQVIIDSFQNSINEYMFKGDIIKLTKIAIVNDLDPCPGYNLEESINLYDKGLIDIKQLDIHVNINKYVKRFEREHGIDIETFILQQNNYDVAINEIYSIFVMYSSAEEKINNLKIKEYGEN